VSDADLCARCGGDCPMTSCPECGGCESVACVTCAAAGPDESCSRRCGYYSSGMDLSLHERYEHTQCGECGRVPRDPYPVTHKPDCPRLVPGYAYLAPSG
jgi:hypothetical protein